MASTPTKTYRYSYSGSDADVYAYYPGMEDEITQLESLHTISVSVHEAKGQARALGYRGIKGIARGVRTIAGSMILTVIEDHPLRQLLSTVGPYMARESATWGGWSFDRSVAGTGTALQGLEFTNRLSTLLPPFNILVQYASEGAKFNEKWSDVEDIRFDTISYQPEHEARRADESRKEYRERRKSEKYYAGTGFVEKAQALSMEIPGAAMVVEGIEIIDSGIVTSINDVVSEISMSFLARDFKPLAPMVYGTTPIQPLPDPQQESIFKKLFGKRDLAAKYDREQSRKRAKERQRLIKETDLTIEEIDAELDSLYGKEF